MSKDFYDNVRNNKSAYPKHIVALCGFCATYNAKWFGGYAGVVHTKADTYRDYYDEAVRNVLKQRRQTADVAFDYKSYENIDVNGALIYCDPPYEGTTKYKDDFNHQRYWDWVRTVSINNIVLCSEYRAPKDFKCVWQKESIVTLDNASRSKAVERLFMCEGLYDKIYKRND